MNKQTLFNKIPRTFPNPTLMYLVKTPRLIQNLFPNYTWTVPTQEKVIYLTFDDGPEPELTPWILQQLDAYQAKATFFLIGENIEKDPDIFAPISAAGHALGNHTYSHVNGWGSDNIAYFHNVRHCARLVKSNLFRPPYGRLMPKQSQFLQRHYQIIMWDVLSGDFDPNVSKEQCLDNVVNNTEAGSIVVFHDNQKAKDKLEYTLPKVLAYFSGLGYRFESLHDTAQNVYQPLQKIA